MANNSPTIVAASLSDDQLKKSIDSLVTHVDEAMKKMVQSTNNAVGEMEAKLKSLGNLKIDSGSSNDGGTGRRTQQHEKLTKAVNDASEAVSKETQKLQDLQQSLSGASDREQNFVSQKELAARTIAQENELLGKQQSELAALKAQEQQLADAHQKDMQSRQQNAAAIEKQRGAVKYYEEEIVSLQARLTSAQAKIDRFYEVQAKARESISSRLHAPSDQFIGYNDYERGKSVYSKTEQDVRSLIKALSELDNADKKHGFGDELRRAYMNLTPSQDMANVFKRQQEEISSYIKTLQEAKKGTKGETRANLDNQILAGKELLAIYKELGNAQNALNKTVQKEGLRDGGNVGGIKRDIEETQKAYNIAKQKLEQLTQSTQQSNAIRQESLNLDAKIQEKLKEISETRGRIATATREQSEADKNASQAAKEKANIQSQVESQEKKVADAKRQLATATQQQTEVEKQSVQNIAQQTAARDKQIKKNQETAISFDQIAAAQQKAAQSQSMSRNSIENLNNLRAQLQFIESEKAKAAKNFGSLFAMPYDQQADAIRAKIREITQGVSVANSEQKQVTTSVQQTTKATEQQIQAQQQQINLTDSQKAKLAELEERYARLKKERQEASKAYQEAGWDRFGAKLNVGAYPESADAQQKLVTAEEKLRVATERLNKVKAEQAQLDKEIETFKKSLNAANIQEASSTQQATQSAQRYTEEIRKQAAAIRATKEWQEKGHVVVGDVNYYDKERANVSKRDKQLLLSLEEQIVQAQQKEAQGALVAAEAKRQQAQATKETANAIKSVSYKTDLQMSLSGFGVKYTQDVTSEQVKQYQTLEEQLQKLKTSYASMNEEAKKSEQGLGISKSIFELQRQRTELLQSIAQQMSKKQTSAATDQFSSLRQSISSVLGVQSENVHLFDAEKASSEQLSKELKMLQLAYSKLSASRIAKGDGTDIANEIQRVQRALQKLQATQTRPTSLKSVMGLDEKTLDDIAYKMRQLASYRSGLDTNSQHNEIRRVNYEYDVLKKKMDEVMQKNSQMISSNTALGRSWNYMKNRLAFYFTVGASTQFIKNLIEVRSQYEMNERALGILVDSAERGTQIFRELSDMALVSPYTLIELSSAAKQLTAYDVAAKDVVDTTRRLADMASAVGVPVERLTYALGQIKAYGYLNSRDARMFANAGIPLVKELADHYTTLEGRLVSTADVYDRIKKKAIDYNDVMQVMNEMTDEGGKFYDFQAKMADTLKVQLANLTLAWNNMLNDLGNSQQGLLTSGIGALKELFLHWKDLDRILTNLAVTIGTAKAAQLLLNMSFGKGTLAAIKNISAIEGNTAAMYENALSKSNLSKAEARWLVSTNRSNVALRAAMVNMKLLTAEEAKAAASTTVLGVRMGWLGRVMKTNFFGLASVVRSAAVGMEMLGKAMLSIATNPVFLAITAAMALVDALLYYNQIAEKTAEMNKAIADNAKEASEAIGDYLKDSVNIGNRAKAAQGVLSVSEGQKAWESIREQIELSSDAASVFVSKLLEEEDINKRVKEGFDVAESIREATNAMAGLNAEALKVSQDSWLWGAFGEGLAEDLEDYIEAVQRGRKNGANIGSRYFAAGERKEAKDELTAFANDAEEIIRDRLGAGVNDAVQLKEAIERIKKEVIAANPQIKGEVKKWFDVEVDRMMAERFGGVYNELSSIQSQFIEHIKRDSGAALRRLSDDILDTSKELDDDVLGAISKAWDKLKDELPAESQDLISKLQKQMDENPLTLRVLLLQAGEQQIRDAIQNDYEKHFYDANIGEKPTRPKDVGSLWGDYKGDFDKFAAAQKKHEKEMVEYNQKNAEWEAKRAEYVAKYGDFNKKNDETREKWAKRVNDEIKAADAEEKAAKHARVSLEAELSLEERKTDARYLSAVKEEQEAKNRKAAAQEAWNYEKLYQEEKGKGRKGSKKDPLLDALKQEISLVEKLQSDYDKLSKSGASQEEALETIRGAYGKTIRLLNAQLGKYGLPQLDISQLITGKDPNKALAHFKQTLDTLVRKGMLTLERSKELEAVVEKFTLSAKTYNLDMITKGLNNELGKLKDEYELAVAIDADPELGNAFADMMGINAESLPHTVKEYADEYSKYINKYLKGKGSEMQLTGDELRGLTRDDINALQSQVDAGTFNQEWFDVIKKAYEDVSGKRKKDLEETEKWKNSLIEKYGNLQDKLTKIYKDSVQNQVNAVKTFGTEDQKSEIVRLQLRLEETDNPAELTEINTEIAKIVKDVTDKNPIALKLVTASDNQTKSDVSKAYWEDFKNSDMYTMTFEDMANNSTRAIELIIDKLNSLKDHVKEDPVSMKALIKSLEDAEKELNARDPFGGIARSLKNMEEASKETKDAQEALWRAEVDVEQAQQAYDNAEDGTPEEREAAQKALTSAIQQRTNAQNNLTKAENKGKKAQENLKSSLQGVTGQLGDVKSLFDTVSKLFRAGGDDETADAIDAISEGFSTMTTVIMGVVAAMILIKMQNPELLAIAAALSVIVGLVSFLSGNDNKKIDEEIKDSELAVKRLENQYKKLQAAVEDAYGTMAYAAEKAAVANKKLQLEEMKRQLRLEQSRDSKDRDDDKIESLRGQIIDLEREIQKATDNWINDMLGINSVGDAVEQLVSSMIDAFRQGEDYMGKFYDSFDSMIENMIMKAIATKVIGEYIESMWNDIKSKAEARSKKEAQDVEETQSKYNEAQNLYDAWVGGESFLKAWMGDEWYEEELQSRKDNLKKAEEEKEKALKEYEKAITPTPSDVAGMKADAEGMGGVIKEWFDATMEEWGIAFGDKSNKNLSNLQQGIQGITEDTAGALEAYMNGVSQQVYLHSELLTQIRDAVVSFDMDVQVATQAQMLLQLQQSYAVQMAIQGILEGWATPSGQAVRVELVS